MTAQIAKRRGLPDRIATIPGTKVRTMRSLTNDYMTIPGGTVGTIVSASLWSKLRFRGEACTCCGVSPVVTLDILDIEPAPAA